jgi:hypothetical protein
MTGSPTALCCSKNIKNNFTTQSIAQSEILKLQTDRKKSNEITSKKVLAFSLTYLPIHHQTTASARLSVSVYFVKRGVSAKYPGLKKSRLANATLSVLTLHENRTR